MREVDMAQQLAPTPCVVRSYQLHKLTGPNYLTWAIRLTLLLKKAVLWDIVSGTVPQHAARDPTYANWISKDIQAQSELLMHLGDRQAQLIRRCKTSSEIW
ncbi:hypothetical protein KP509_1Z109000 [Ceratopteris richardii]|nr:hypothetical protein KP509_1Z218500 [Ceratopteris richardii]KAH6556153.1 hypothetical protein KP509_1Z201000 [Ceratopteris richardii]KAH6557523.1 hypothetical protein KP509_1Z109000 [Ceratopteris richardii]